MADKPRFAEVKDSGVREEFETGMVRDTQDGKPRFDLLLPEGIPYPEQFLTRCAQHLANGAAKYSARNWEQARTQTELDRYKSSALRHLVQWFNGEEDEDHAAAVFFNLMGAEFVKYHLAIPALLACLYCCGPHDESTCPDKPFEVG